MIAMRSLCTPEKAGSAESSQLSAKRPSAAQAVCPQPISRNDGRGISRVADWLEAPILPGNQTLEPTPAAMQSVDCIQEILQPCNNSWMLVVGASG